MREVHPYGEFIPKKCESMIIGSFPIAKFSDPKRRKEIKPHEYDFPFGGEKNLLWKLLGHVFQTKISSRDDIIRMLKKQKIGVGDVIRSCRRKNGGGSDTDLYDIEWNTDLLDHIRKNKVKRLYFTSKKVEAWFHRLFPNVDGLELISLISPSAQSVRSIPRREDFRKWIKKNPDKKIVDFIFYDYTKKFESKS